ncbi:MAG: 4,5-DOPA dioxygenase extradiol [Actinobacteria bacterium]|nr:4,5-DOPA dioxygenase extradiol [Actinomycetota bacterium]
MNAVETNRYTTAWSEVAVSFPKPRAIVAISAHWYVNQTAVTSMARPRVIHDFLGFPQELFAFDYPVVGSPDLARRVADLVQPDVVALDDESWGIDHGTWSVLAHMYPQADVPVVQLAIDATRPLDYHLEIGAKLAPLMSEDVLILASGNVVHNLRQIAWDGEHRGYDWAQRFDDDAHYLMTNNPAHLGELRASDDYDLAVPTADHFLPLAYIAGIAAVANATVSTFARGCTMGSLSMTSYHVGNAGLEASFNLPREVRPGV